MIFRRMTNRRTFQLGNRFRTLLPQNLFGTYAHFWPAVLITGNDETDQWTAADR